MGIIYTVLLTALHIKYKIQLWAALLLSGTEKQWDFKQWDNEFGGEK